MRRKYVKLQKIMDQAKNFNYIKNHLTRLKSDIGVYGGNAEMHIKGGEGIIDLVEDLVKKEVDI